MNSRRCAVPFFSFLLLIFATSSKAIEAVSIRMKTLGSDFQGVLLDEYTDVLANPARQRLWKEPQLHGKIGANQQGAPMALGYSSRAVPVFLLAEGKFTESSSLTRTENVTKVFNGSLLEQDGADVQTRSDSYGVAGISGFGSERFGWGIGLFYDATNSLNDSETTNKDVTVDSMTAKTINYQESKSLTDTESKSSQPTARLGLHWSREAESGGSSERDLVLSAYLPHPDSHTHSVSELFVDSDPDASNPVTPVRTLTRTRNFIDRRYARKVGGGLEFHSRHSAADAQTGVLLSASFQPDASVEEKLVDSYTENVLGSTVTTTLTGSRINRAYKGRTYSGVAATGGKWRVWEKVWLGSGLRLNASHAYSSQKFTYTSSNTAVGTSKVKAQSDDISVRVPLCMEAGLAKFLVFRGSVTGRWNYTRAVETDNNAFFNNRRRTSTTTSMRADIGAGFGAFWKDITVDLYSTGYFLDDLRMELQVRYLFGKKPSAPEQTATLPSAPVRSPAAAPAKNSWKD